MAPDSLNIILFGETGVGKSSVINLIAGEQVAGTSSDAVGCTMSSTLHEFSIKGRQFHIWDTVGLEEPTMGVNGYLPAIEKSIELIQRLSSQSGVDLLLMCIRGNRLTATTQSNYRLFYEGLCGSKVPIAFVITHLEWEDDMEDWWTRNVKHVENFGMKCAGHACITTLKRARNTCRRNSLSRIC
jgi:tRNA U34 5-carboxymethylaminomethyl modifying GTPase MnmE/TrmE